MVVLLMLSLIAPVHAVPLCVEISEIVRESVDGGWLSEKEAEEIIGRCEDWGAEDDK